MNEIIRFKETQKFTQWWLWLLILAPIFLSLLKCEIDIYGQLTADSPFISVLVVMPSWSWVGVIIYVLTILFMLFSTLDVYVTDKEISIRHLLFFRKAIFVE